MRAKGKEGLAAESRLHYVAGIKTSIPQLGIRDLQPTRPRGRWWRKPPTWRFSYAL